ncbi:MAG: metallophosphoesterase [Promethearchaeota archaeon]
MKESNIDKKKIILQKLISSGINVTPFILDLFLSLDDPIKSVDQIVKDTSFIPNFNSHLTSNILKQISNAEIQKVLKRTLLKEKYFQSEENNTLDIVNTEKSKDQISRTKTKNQEVISKLPEIKNNLEILKPEPIFADFSKEIPKKIEITRKKSYESTKSSLKFYPIAKEYDSNYEILKDPTGKLYTHGDYKDFYDLTLDKFNKLRTLMKKRPDVLSAHNINNILRISNKVEVSVIGMVSEIRKTKKSNFFLVLEDITGQINVLIRNDSENQDNVKIVEKTLNDQLVYVAGTYNPGEKGKSGIIYGEYISKIDIPTDFQPNVSPDPLSIALISDTHIGSREFEESLLKRFLDFLNGKIGNKNLREIAGKIKYIIINGDLVDGIGIYPSQQDDLIIPDIYNQFKKASELFSEIPEYIEVFYSPGNHEPVRNALPRPSVPKKYMEDLINIGFKRIGNPSIIQTHNVNTLVYHGDSILDMNILIPELENTKPIETMKELLICRHLAPVYGKKTQIAPTDKDWLVIDKIPEIFHTGHIHINGIGKYRNVTLVNSGCFQTQTDFMKSFGINPTPGIVPIIELDTFKSFELNLKNNE